MNCRDVENWLQERLDVGRIPATVSSTAIGSHVAECEACRRGIAAARLLCEGLSAMPALETSKLLSATIAAAVVKDRVQRRRRNAYRWSAIGAMAASVALLFVMGWIPTILPPRKVEVAIVPTKTPPTKPATELAQRAEDASKAVATLTRNVTEKTKSRLGALLPDAKSLDVELPQFPGFDEPLDPAAQSLKTAGLTMVHALDPVANSTVQAFGFFTREMPGIDFSKE